MNAEEPQRTKPGSPRMFVIAFLCLVAVLLVGLPVLQKWRESGRVHKQREWIRSAVLELGKAGPPPDDHGQPPPYYPWVTQDYLIFSNGWAAYRIHTAHSSRAIGDIALLRLSDGRFYSSGLHYCTGIKGGMRDSPDRVPVDAQEFFDRSSKTNAWSLLSQDGRIQCAVFCPDADHESKHKKVLWVSIYSSINGIETNLFEGRYLFSGKFLSWKTHWFSNDDLSVEIFNRDWPPDFYPKTPPTSLAILKFHRDQQTGRFTDQKP